MVEQDREIGWASLWVRIVLFLWIKLLICCSLIGFVCSDMG